MKPRDCAGKVSFTSFALAEKVAKLRRKGNRHAYHCSECGGFHLGRRVGGKRGQRPRVEPILEAPL